VTPARTDNSSARPASERLLDILRPEWRAGGYARDNGGVAFYSRVNALLRPDMVVIDLGAGRGETFHTGEFGFFQGLAKLQGKVKRVIGVDVDDAIMDHPHLDERHVVGVNDPFPVADGAVDMVVADWVFEHVDNPQTLARELERVVKPGGWVCARTPNKWGYVGTGARMLPNRFHTGLLKTLWPGRQAVDVFPTRYRLNSVAALNRQFASARWDNFSYRSNPTPKYVGHSAMLFWLVDLVQTALPGGMKTDLIVMLRRRGPSRSTPLP